MPQASNKVVILGGGVAGMSAAHELVHRGFDVVVLEAKDIPGGKARSIAATVDGLPGEHGFRFFPSFYQHLTDTMRGIPFAGNARGVFDNLVDTSLTGVARFGKEPVELGVGFPKTPREVLDLALDAFGNPFDLTDEETRFFGQRLMQIATSCQERRLDEYEGIGWWEFINADGFSENYRRVLGSTTRSLVAADPRKASARTIGDITLQAVLGVTTPGKVYDRVLNGPTSAAWIQPWHAHLLQSGVDYRLSTVVEEILSDGARITGVKARHNNVLETFTGDWFIAAVPVEKMAPLVTPSLLALDAGLSRIPMLAPHVSWMNGLQFYLKQAVPVVHGHVLFVDAPWALTSISQAQFWPKVDFASFGDGRIRDCLSVDISDWDTPGLCGKPAKACTREEIVEDVWRQLRASLNGGGVLRLTDEMLHSSFLDPGIQFNASTGITEANQEPLLVNHAGTWALRPQAKTGAPNLMLASDYVQTHTDLACMEGANEAARRAVNAILQASGSNAARCRLWPLTEPTVLKPWQMRDRERWERGEPWDVGALD